MRCAMIKNYVVKNEAVDPAVIIERLKRENAQLKAELVMLKGGSKKSPGAASNQRPAAAKNQWPAAAKNQRPVAAKNQWPA